MRYEGSLAESEPVPLFGRRLRAVYHLPGNADVRIHLLAAALLTGWFLAELAFVFYFATAAAQGVAAQTAAQVRDSVERREGGSG